MNHNIRRLIGLVLAISLIFGLAPATTWTISAEETNTDTISAAEFAGKKVSILGDSISTYTGISNNTSYNTTIGSNAVYYKTPGQSGIYQEDTWWQQLLDLLDMELCVNNSWSGSCILPKRAGTVGCYVSRCVQLHNDNTGEEPDVILVFMGTNDFSYYSTAGSSNGDLWGTFDLESARSVITQNDDGSYTYTTPATVYEAYAITLHKMQVRYPDAEIYCMGLMARRDPDYNDGFADVGQPTEHNAAIKELVEDFGCTYIDMESCIGSDSAVFDLYMADKRVHPNAAGMDQMTKAVISGMLGLENAVCEVTYDLTNVTADTDAEMIVKGQSFEVTLSKDDGYTDMNVSITMDGEDVTEECYAGGKINIAEVTGDIAIAVQGVSVAQYRWEMGTDGVLTPITTDGYIRNRVTVTSGKVTNGTLSSYSGTLENAVVLSCDQEWFIEWKSNGDWTGMLLLSDESTTADDAVYVYRNTNKLLVIGHRSNNQYNNYGIDTTGIADDSTVRTFRLENRVADGANMVYLVIDDIEIGAMNNYYIASELQDQPSSWLNRQELTFRYVGASNTSDTFDVNNMQLKHLEINTDASEHKHAYAVTEQMEEGTCQTEGYTVYVCSCNATKNVYNGVKGDHEYGAWQEVDGVWQRECVHGDSTQTAAAAVNGNDGYLTLEDALDAAVEGDTVTMWADQEVSALELSKGITLDLNGHILTAGYAIFDAGNSIMDSHNGSGVLKTDKGSLVVQADNGYLPIWNGTDGYVFTACAKCQAMTATPKDNATAFYFLPWMDENVHNYLAAGSETSGVQLKVKVAYKVNGREYTEDKPNDAVICVFGKDASGEELIKRFYDGYTAGSYASAFKLTLTGTDTVEDLSFEVYFESERGAKVTVCCYSVENSN